MISGQNATENVSLESLGVIVSLLIIGEGDFDHRLSCSLPGFYDEKMNHFEFLTDIIFLYK